MRTSRNTRLGLCDNTASTALRPSAHSATIWTSGSSAMNLLRRARAAASSSAISTDSDMPFSPALRTRMPGQHDESVEFEKRLRYESSALWDETSEPSFPRRWAVPLMLGAAAYALYRAVQTNVLDSSGGP